ncbi:MAG: SGNH/GDSL hydrolase family protein [Actinomycetaceae bacterium]|nr:SGNH/GDSL hydrolase family protein [Actinomycetaceae bacterium]
MGGNVPESMAGKVAGVSLAAGTTAAYMKAKSVSKMITPFRRAWELHLRRGLLDLERRAVGGGEWPFIYVALGDSAAQGIGAASIEQGYVPRIAAGLRAVLGREVTLLNLSLSGATTESVLVTQLPQLEGLRVAGEPLRPDLVTLDIGGNDVGLARLSEAEFADNAALIAERLPTAAFVGNIPTFKPLPVASRASRLSEHLTSAMRDGGHRVVDLQSVSEQFSLWTYMARYHAPDMFHPNSPWYHRWSQLFMEAICERMGLARIDMREVPAFDDELAVG